MRGCIGGILMMMAFFHTQSTFITCVLFPKQFVIIIFFGVLQKALLQLKFLIKITEKVALIIMNGRVSLHVTNYSYVHVYLINKL